VKYYCFKDQAYGLDCFVKEAKPEEVAESLFDCGRQEWMNFTYNDLLDSRVFLSLEDWQAARNEMLEEEIAELEDRIRQLKEYQNSEPRIY
jgi:hypothetical protein